MTFKKLKNHIQLFFVIILMIFFNSCKPKPQPNPVPVKVLKKPDWVDGKHSDIDQWFGVGIKSSEDSKYIEIKSPIIGTFYRKPSPDKPSFVEVGDSISEGSVLCVIEAMKLFNEIESDISGTIVKVLVEDSTPVEFDQPLFLIDPS